MSPQDLVAPARLVPASPGPTGHLHAWIETWPLAREELIGLLEAYARTAEGHDISSFLAMLDDMDAAVRLLEHRAAWLRERLPTPA